MSFQGKLGHLTKVMEVLWIEGTSKEHDKKQNKINESDLT